jgi:predicted NUDIX family NTP pyrophosphohydrolase
MAKQSAGILMYRLTSGRLEVFLVHPGGPFWAKKDKAAWSIPKGEYEEGEDPLDAARRELTEETGISLDGALLDLGELRQPSRKVVHAWATEHNCDPSKISSNTFTLEWPPKSGKQQEFPEIDRAEWFPIPVARIKLHRGQVGFIDKLLESLGLPEESATEAEDEPPKQLGLF